jgi:carboxyl-terminal processing protease
VTRPGVAALLLAVLLVLGGCARGGGPAGTVSQGPAGKERISATTAAHLERTFDEIMDTLERNYVYGAERHVQWSGLRDKYRPRIRGVAGVDELAGVVRALLAEIADPAVSWQSREDRIKAELEYSTRYEGIGTYIGFRATPVPRVVILDVIPESPAEHAGIVAHDAILAIDGGPVRADEAATVAGRIRGPRGTSVRLTVSRPGAGRRELSVQRERVDLGTVQYPLRSGYVGSTSVAYVELPRAASDSLAEDIPAALDRLSASGRPTGILIDLRISGTGSFPLEGILACFASGKLGTVYTAASSQELSVEGQDHDGSQSLPLAVLVGPDTEGPAEILAAALQTAGRAIVVGWQTPGSVEREQQFGLVDGSRLWMPVWSYRTQKGVAVGKTGVMPDVAVSADWDAVSDASDAVRQAAAKALAAGRRK